MKGAFEDGTGKLGLGVLRYSSHVIDCLIDPHSAGRSAPKMTGIQRDCPIVATVEEAARLGANVLVLGTAPPGGLIPRDWWSEIDRAVELGMSLVNGLHDLLAPRYGKLSKDQFVWDVRVEPSGLGVGTAAARSLSARRVLMVGSDMSVGKMTAALELTKTARSRGVRTAFVATGQTGIVIEGSGVPLDAVRLDYATGAIEREVCRHGDVDLIVVEGQGSLLHPGSSATLPLLRGTCPTHLVLCHRAGMDRLARVTWVKVPPLSELARLYEDLSEACGTFVRAPVIAVSLNTSHLDDAHAKEANEHVEKETGLPTCDPVRDGAVKLFDAVMS